MREWQGEWDIYHSAWTLIPRHGDDWTTILLRPSDGASLYGRRRGTARAVVRDGTTLSTNSLPVLRLNQV